MKIRNLLTTLALTATFLIAGKVGWAQTIIGSYPQMDGGFEGQTVNPSTTLYGTTWTHNASSAVLNMSDGRSGPKYITLTQSGTNHKRLISPDVTGILASTSYVVQFYYQGDLDGTVGTNTIRAGITQDHSLSATFVYSSYLSPNTGLTWTKFYTVLTCNSTAPNLGNGIISINNTSQFNIDDFVVYAGSAVDETAPNSPGAVTINNETTNSLDISWVAADDVDGGGYVVVRYTSDPGTGNDPNQNGIYAIGNTVPTGGTVVYIGTSTSFTDNSLTQGTQYWYKVYTVDKAFNYSDESTNSGTTLADVTAPSWIATYPKVTDVHNSDFNLLMNIDETGTVYYVVLENGKTAPNAAQVKAFTDGDGNAAYKFGSKIIGTASTEFTQNISGLSAGTVYDVYAVAEDDASNLQATPAAIADVTTTNINPEPSENVSALAVGTVTSNSINITWTDAAGAQLPDGYIIQVKTGGVWGTPVDGTPIPEDTDLSDGGAIYIGTGLGTYTLTGLAAATTYDIRVISYTNTGAAIDYKTDVAIPEVSASTPMINLIAPNGGDIYYAGDNVNIQWSSIYMDTETIKIEAYAKDGGTGLWGWMTIATSEANDGSYSYTIPSDARYGIDYKIRVTGKTTGTTDESDNSFTVKAVASNLADLHSMSANDIVKYIGKATVTYARTSRNQKYIQDASGAVLIDDPTTAPGYITGTYNIGDGITNIEGKITFYNGLTEFVPQAATGESCTGNPVITPTVKTMADLTTADQSTLVKVVNFTLADVSGGTGLFAVTSTNSAKNYNMDDGSVRDTVYQFRTAFSEADYIGTPLPITDPKTATALVGMYIKNASSKTVMQITSRNLADFQSAVAKVTSSVYTVDDGISGISNVPYTISVADFKANITPATNATFNVYDADGTTEATVINDTKLVKVTAEDGLTTKTYTITRVAANNDATLSTLTINGEDAVSLASIIVANPADAGATMWFDNFTNAKGIVATQNDANATIEIKLNDVIVADPVNQVLADNNVILITVTAEDGTTIKYYKVELQQRPIITATAGLNGTITPSGSVAVDYDINKAFDVTASGGYHISALTVDGSGISEAVGLTTYTYTFNNVVDDHTIDATFALTTYTVTFNVTDGTNPIEGATVSFNTTNANTDASGVAVFTDVAPATLAYSVVKTGYYDINSNVSVSNSDKTVNVTMILATVPTYTVTFNVKEATVAVEGATVSLTGYGDQTTDASGVATFANVGAANGIAYTVNKTGYEQATGTVDVVDANVSEDVDLTKLTYTISASAGVNGTITPNNDVTVTYGTDQSFIVEASTGYHIASLLVDGSAVTAAANLATYTYPFTNVTANHTIAATFAINTYTITVTAGLNGTTSPNTNQTVNYSDNLSFTVAANANYHIKDVLVDGASIGAVASYDFTNVTANHTFETQFEVDSHTITANVTPAGAGTVSGAGDYNYGATVTLTATENIGYEFIGWQINSVQVSTNLTYTFTATTDVTVDAVFEVEINKLFISEYLEGSSNNKAIEIYNPKSRPVDLSQYSLKKGTNGADFSNTLALTGTLEPNSVYVIANAGAIDSITSVANYIDAAGTIVYFNGDDAIGLFKNNILIDVIGTTTGIDPGTNWPVAGTGATSEFTLVRKDAINYGTTDWNASAGTDADNSQWVVYPQNRCAFLGWHRVKSNLKDILTFTLAEQTGNATINATNQTVNIEVANGTDVTALVPTITVSKGATINPASETAQDFTNPVIYTVIAQDGTTQDWAVTVSISTALSNAKDILTFSLAEQTTAATIDATAHTVNIEVAYGTTVTTLVPTITVSNFATVSPASGIAQDFTVPVTYTVTAQDGSTQTWTITVSVSNTPSSEKDITSFAIASQVSSTIDPTAATVIVVMPYGTNMTNLTPTIAISRGASIDPVSGAVQDFSNPVQYTVTAQDASTKSWTVTVTAQENALISIYNIQYTTDATGNSPYLDQKIRTKGIVTAAKTGTSTTSFFLQDGTGPWCGIYVYGSATQVSVGDSVELVATVSEYYNETELKTITNLTIINSGNTAPTPTSVSLAEAGSEAYEGVLVSVSNVECTVAADSYGAWTISDGTSTLLVDDVYYAYTPTVGTHYNITGIVDYTYSAFKMYPRFADDVEVYTPSYTVTFNVTHNSTALPGATITVNSQTLTTDANGSATIDLANGDYSYSVTMTGYTDHTGSFTVADAAKTVDVAMFLTGVETNTIAKLKVFPNPFNNEIRYEGTDITRVTITSIIGQVVMEKQLFGNESINTSNLVRGIYLVKFTNNKGETTLRKLIKE